MAMTFVDRSVEGLVDVARGAHGDWILTSRATVNDDRFAERCYASALFTLPGMVPGRPDLALLPNPVERYCIDFAQEVNWTQGQKMRAGRRRRFRFSMDRDFAGSLAKLRAFHGAGKDGTWFDDALFAMIVRAHRRQRTLDGSGDGGVKGEARPSSAKKGSQAGTAGPLVRHHVFELWDAESDELLAVTAGFACGRAYHDYSMACLVRDSRSAGHVLSKTVGHLLSACGYDFWYWGFKTDYMQHYDKFGGRSIGRGEFFDRWARVVRESPAAGLAETIASGRALVAPV